MGILYAPYAVAVHFDRVVQRRLHLVVAAEGIQPIRQIESDRLDWKLLKHAPHYAAHVVFIKCLAVHAQTADAEFLLKLCRRTDGRVRLRLRAVHKHDEGLIYPLQLLDNALLRLKIFLALDSADAAVGRDYDADVECSAMTRRVPSSAAVVILTSCSNHGVATRRSTPFSNCPAAPSTMYPTQSTSRTDSSQPSSDRRTASSV